MIPIPERPGRLTNAVERRIKNGQFYIVYVADNEPSPGLWRRVKGGSGTVIDYSGHLTGWCERDNGRLDHRWLYHINGDANWLNNVWYAPITDTEADWLMALAALAPEAVREEMLKLWAPHFNR